MPNEYPYHRFAISVNRKIGKAVQRNYIKRVMKEWFRLNRQVVTNRMRNYDMWIVIKGKFDRTNVKEIEQLFLYSLKKINQ